MLVISISGVRHPGAGDFILDTSRFTTNASLSLPAAGHVVDEGAVDIGATATDGIEQRVRICDKILFIGELVRNDLGVTDVAEHHQATRHADRFSSCACSHGVYTDPF